MRRLFNLINPFLFLTAVVAIIYRSSFLSYFSQDDFFQLRASQANSVKEFLNFFVLSPARGYSFYRPLFREVYDFVMWRIFGLNPLPFHLVQFFLFILFAVILYKFLCEIFSKNFKQSEKLSFTAALLYSTSAIHLGTFYYLSSIQILSAAIFSVLSINLFVKNKYLASYIVYFFSLLCHEISYAVPFLIVLTIIFKGTWKTKIKNMIPFFLLMSVFVLLNVFLVKLPNQSAYLPKFSFRSLINNLFWYINWSLGIPEHMSDYVGPGIKLNPRIILQYPKNFWMMTICFIALIPLLLFSLIKNFISKSNSEVKRVLLFSFFWFLTGISLFLLLPSHRFVYYLIVSEIGISLGISALIINLPKKIGLIFFFLVFLLNINSICWGEKTYWPLTRGKLAKKVVDQIKQAYPSLPKGATLYLKDDPNYISPSEEWGETAKQAFFALSGADGLQLLYKDFTLKAFFENVSSPSGKASFDLIIKI